MIFKKILNFFDKSNQIPSLIDTNEISYGKLYKIKNEALPFRYIYRKGDDQKSIYRFKHHQLKEYIFYNLDEVEREANKKEIYLYNKIKNYINEIARQENNINYN